MNILRGLGTLLLTCSVSAAPATGRTQSSDCGPRIERVIAGALEGSPRAIVCPWVPALAESVVLEVGQVRWDALLHRLNFRLHCRPSSACLPFLVSVSGPEFLAKQRNRLQASRGPLLVRAGQVVRLHWRAGAVQIDRKVVCLDAGRKGQRVRIRAQAGGRIVHGRVTGEGIVEASL